MAHSSLRHAADAPRHGAAADASPPNVCLLSNGRYSVVLTRGGERIQHPRWLGRDALARGRDQRLLGTVLLHPRPRWRRRMVGRSAAARWRPDDYEATLGSDRAVFQRRDANVETRYEIAVAADADAEVRRITLTNHGALPRTLEVSSYAEVSLNGRRADQAHPAFAKLFLETEYLPAPSTLLCRRRPRARDQKPIWALHFLAGPERAGIAVGEVEYETDRARFLGRGRSSACPAALDSGAALSGTVGPVLDPVFSLRRRVRLAPGTSAVLAFGTAMAVDRDEAVALARRFSDLAEVARTFDQARIHSQATLAALGITPEDAACSSGWLLTFSSPGRPFGRESPSPKTVSASRACGRTPSPEICRSCWPDSLGPSELDLAGELIRAHAYWRRCGLVADLVLLNDAEPADELHDLLEELVRLGPTAELADKPGGVFLRTAGGCRRRTSYCSRPRPARSCAGTRAHWPRSSSEAPAPDTLPADLPVTAAKTTATPDKSSAADEALLFANGLGGFTLDGREYALTLRGRERPPAPWSNVLANPGFGCLITEAGAGYTWAGNAQMNRLTPWSNDPVADPPGEALYLRDEETGEFWSPAPSPCGGDATTVVRHGQGYTRFTKTSHGLVQDLVVFVAAVDPVKLIRLRVSNLSARPRRLSATFYVEWVLGALREQAPLNVLCTLDPESGAIFARSAWAGDFAGRVGFADVARRPRSFTTDRTEFLGRYGAAEAPAALGRERLSDRAGELCDPCAAFMTELELPPGGEDVVFFLLGQAETEESARRHIRFYGEAGRADKALEEVTAEWDRILGTVQVHTPDPALDLMLNRWLIYQALACRVWGRTGVLPVGRRFRLPRSAAGRDGAGLRRRRGSARRRSCGRPPGSSKRGTCSTGGTRRRAAGPHADLRRSLFLPFVTCHYVATTGDTALLDERVPFLRAPVLRPEQEEDYGLPDVSDATGTALRALRASAGARPEARTARPAADGHRRLERRHEPGRSGGKGESVWNGWFMLATLRRVCRPGRAAPGQCARGLVPGASRGAASERWRSTPGTAAGTDGRTSTTALRSARRRTRSARSIRSPRRGR